MKKTLKFWNLIQNQRKANLMLYGDIGENIFDDVYVNDVVTQIKNLDVDEIEVNINSLGGSVTAAIAIANTLKAHNAKTIAIIDGIAASAATIITSKCDVVKMPKNALFMIHNPWTVVGGEKKDLEKTVEVLDKIKDSIIETYQTKTGITKEKLSELMDNESWFNAVEAKEYKFIDEIIEDVNLEILNDKKLIVNNMVFDLENFKNFRKLENKEEEKIMNKEELLEKYPGLYEEIKNEGILEERKRIEEIENLNVTGEMVYNAKFRDIKNAKDLAYDLVVNRKVEREESKVEKQDILNKIKVENQPILNSKEDKTVDRDVIIAQGILKFMNGGKK